MNFNILSCCSPEPNPYQLPWRYEFLDVLGEGSYGCVLRCQETHNKEIVAIKIPKSDNREELAMMKRLKSFDLHKHNVVKFLDSFSVSDGYGLVMEALDISLDDYLYKTWSKIMPLSDIRGIVQQMATALDALKNIGVIHTDIKPDNIMMVDHRTRPFRVKLIDFGLAIRTHTTKLGMCLQPLVFRAPEVILGLLFTEAIDMWALGCVLAFMLTKALLFQGQNENEVLQCIVFHLGQPADHLLDEALRANKFFSWRKKSGWKFKEDLSPDNPSSNYVEKMREERMDNKSEAEVSEAKECVDLLLAMLEVNPTERITPAEVLAHPFILQTQVKETSRPASLSSTSDCEPPATAPKDNDTTNIQPAHHNPSPTIPPSRVIYVQPATAENTRQLEDEECALSLQTQVKRTSRPASLASTSDCESPATAPKDNDTTNIQPTHHNPSPTIPPSRVIYVQPATAENTQQLEDEECALSVQAGLKKTSESPETITDNDRISKDSTVTESDTTMTESYSTVTENDSTVTESYSTVTENDSTVTENDSTVTESDPKTSTSEDSSTCGQTELSSKKKKRKNCFRRFCSWMKKTFSCVTCVDE